MYMLDLGKRFERLNLCSFAAHLKLNFYLQSFAPTPTLMFVHLQFQCEVNNVGVFQEG